MGMGLPSRAKDDGTAKDFFPMNPDTLHQQPSLSIVCPLHNEEENVEPFFARLLPALYETRESFEIVCVNDGSEDATLDRILEIQKAHASLHLRIIDLSRNFGKEAALSCGLHHACGKAVIPIDADLQHPPEVINEMVALWRQGFEVVLPQRIDRATDTIMRCITSLWFYRLFNMISEHPIPPNVGDFRLMDRKVVDALNLLPERQRFMKGLFAWVGFRQAIIPYDCESRSSGRSKFSVWRLWNLALDGISAFSTTPLRIWTYVGLVIALLALSYGTFIVGKVLLFGKDLPGYASLMTVILFLGGIQLIGLGVLGEYLGRVYRETKQRPLYIVRAKYENPQTHS